MAKRRMFSLEIVDTDAFLEMPSSTQSLYFHFGMRADDEGFVGNPRRLIRMLGVSEDDYKLLIAKSFVIPFESGVCVIKHWKMNNYLQNDRLKPTTYLDEKKLLQTKENKAYTLDKKLDVYKLDTECIHSIGKSSIEEVSIVESSIVEDKPKRTRFIKPSIDDINNYLKEKGLKIDVQHFIDYYESNGWKVGKNAMKDWKATVRNWARRDNGFTKSTKEVETEPDWLAEFKEEF